MLYFFKKGKTPFSVFSIGIYSHSEISSIPGGRLMIFSLFPTGNIRWILFLLEWIPLAVPGSPSRLSCRFFPHFS
jgi:hypothetical protein